MSACETCAKAEIIYHHAAGWNDQPEPDVIRCPQRPRPFEDWRGPATCEHHAAWACCPIHGAFDPGDEDGNCPTCVAVGADWCAGAG